MREETSGAPSACGAASKQSLKFPIKFATTIKIYIRDGVTHLSGETRKVETDRVAVGTFSGEGLCPVWLRNVSFGQSWKISPLLAPSVWDDLFSQCFLPELTTQVSAH